VSKPAEGKETRRRRAERLLGDLLPDQTGDESGDAWGERADSRDEELRRDVPPHHGS
jgi:hypothetical protein